MTTCSLCGSGLLEANPRSRRGSASLGGSHNVWARSHGAAIERYDRLMDELKTLEAPGLPMLTVALGDLRGLARCPSALPAAAPLPPP
jgi:hypothetical protein